MTLTVGHIVRAYLPRSATFVHTTLRFQRGARPVVLAGRTENDGEFPFEPVVALTPPEAPRLARAARRLRARASGYATAYDRRLVVEARRWGCDVLHAHWGHVGWRALDARDELDRPLVTTFYGHDVGYGMADATWRERYRRLFDEGARFCVEGPAMRRSLEQLGCPAAKVAVVPIGLDLDLFGFAPRERAGRLTVTLTGRMIDKKGFDVGLRAFAAALPRLGDSELLLVGDGPLRPALEALAAELRLGDAVRFLGSLSHTAYRDVLVRTDIGLQPSRTAADGDTEGGAPTVLLELQAAGIPVVATRHADIPFVVACDDALAAEDDVEAIADALVRVATEEAGERRTRAERGRALVEDRHDARRVAERLLAVYAAAT